LAFSIAESAGIFFERDVPSPQGPPVLASTLISIPARPARQKGRTQTGHPFLVEESDSNQAIPSTQRWSAPLGGWQPAAPGPSHHVTPNERGASSASHAIHADITPPAQPCYSTGRQCFDEINNTDRSQFIGGLISYETTFEERSHLELEPAVEVSWTRAVITIL
jgi:hypothetical protein